MGINYKTDEIVDPQIIDVNALCSSHIEEKSKFDFPCCKFLALCFIPELFMMSIDEFSDEIIFIRRRIIILLLNQKILAVLSSTREKI